MPHSSPPPLTGYRRWCDRIYWRLVDRLTPGLRNSQYAYARALAEEAARASSWLDLGCGHDFLPPFVAARVPPLPLDGLRTVGVDADLTALSRHPSVKFRVGGDIERLPLRAESFDLVTSNMVLEHVARPERLFAEMLRVLRPGGRLLLHTPNAEGYTTLLTRLVPARLVRPLAKLLIGRQAEDVYPTWYRANDRKALERLLTSGGWRDQHLDFVESSAQLVIAPPLLVVELLAIRTFRSPGLQRLRACLLLRATRAGGTGQFT